jgi:type IV secretion system protein VirB1
VGCLVTALTVQAALAVALQCAPSVDPHMLAGIAQHESGLETQILHDNGTGKVLRGAGILEAAAQLIAAGHSVDLGVMQINSRNLGLLGLSLTDAFDACHSIAGAARLIQLFSAYNTGSPTRGIANGYALKVVTSIGRVKGASIDSATLVPPDDVAIEDTPATGELFFTTEGP